MPAVDVDRAGLLPDRWPLSVAEAQAEQERLRPLVVEHGPLPAAPRTVAGLDVSYATGDDRLAAAVVVLSAQLTVVESATGTGRAAFG